jgi:predicted DNA-binding WGR domain protein
MRPVYLERIDAARGMARFYAIRIAPTLFGDWAIVYHWGRIGTAGQSNGVLGRLMD